MVRQRWHELRETEGGESSGWLRGAFGSVEGRSWGEVLYTATILVRFLCIPEQVAPRGGEAPTGVGGALGTSRTAPPPPESSRCLQVRGGRACPNDTGGFLRTPPPPVSLRNAHTVRPPPSPSLSHALSFSLLTSLPLSLSPSLPLARLLYLVIFDYNTLNVGRHI